MRSFVLMAAALSLVACSGGGAETSHGTTGGGAGGTKSNTSGATGGAGGATTESGGATAGSGAAGAGGAGGDNQVEVVRGIYGTTTYGVQGGLSVHSFKYESTWSSPDLEGVFERLWWSTIQDPTSGDFTWNYLDNEFETAAKNGKKVSLAIMAGAGTPTFLFAQGVPTVTIWDSRLGTGTPHQVTVPVVWNQTYEQAVKKMVTTLAAHLHSKSDQTHHAPYYDILSSIKIEGIQDETEETRLSAASYETSMTSQATALQNAAEAWSAVGYKPSLVLGAFEVFADDYADAFPDKTLQVDYITGVSFPEVGENAMPSGNEMSSSGLVSDIQNYMLTHYGDRYMGMYTALQKSSKFPGYKVPNAQYVGYQIAQTPYSNPGSSITTMEFEDLFSSAATVGAHDFEIWEADLSAFPQAFPIPY